MKKRDYKKWNMPIPKVSFAPPVYMCRRAKEKFELDGNIFKKFWEDAPFTDSFSDIEGEAAGCPRFETKAKMLWDDENLYFGAVLYGDEIWGSITKRDSVIFYDNDFEIFIDPDSDTHRYFEYEMNVLNTVWDLFLDKPYRDGGKPLNGWDIRNLRSAVSVSGEVNRADVKSRYWSVEVVIPFSALFEMADALRPPIPGEYYRMNFSRVQWEVDKKGTDFIKRTDEMGCVLPENNWVWAPTGVVNIHYPELWGFVFFADGEENYEIPIKEYLAWELRQLYYLSHQFRDKNGYFTSDLEKLGYHSKKQVEVEATENMFEITIYDESLDIWIRISDDGKVNMQS